MTRRRGGAEKQHGFELAETNGCGGRVRFGAEEAETLGLTALLLAMGAGSRLLLRPNMGSTTS